MDALAIFNCFEAAWWISVGFFIYRRGRAYRIGRVASVWFVLFGISDIIEVFTGAPWRPWPLLVYKGICIIVLISCGQIYRARLRRQRYKLTPDLGPLSSEFESPALETAVADPPKMNADQSNQ